MSYLALCSERFEETATFYRDALGGRELKAWDRTGARGVLLDVQGLRLEILDAARERQPLELGDPKDRVHLVIEVEDLAAFLPRAPREQTSWALVARLRDPDGVAVTVIERRGPEPPPDPVSD